MLIKKIQDYDGYTANLVVTDGKYDLLCFCLGFHDNATKPFEPKEGMEITGIETFVMDGIKIQRIENNEEKAYLIKKGKLPLEYTLRAKVLDNKKAKIGIGELIINLENYFEDGLPENCQNGNFIEFTVDRLDCTIE